MKNIWIWVIVIAILAVVGYAYRAQIMQMLGYSSGTPLYTTNTSPSSAPTGEILTWKTANSVQYAVGANGMTLYTFDKDTKGVSNCNGSCAGVWPPYTTTNAPTKMPTNVTVITRADGTMQYAYKGMPLYYYTGDKNVGDMTGDGFNGIWHIVKP